MKFYSIIIRYRLYIGLALVAIGIITNIYSSFWPAFLLFELGLLNLMLALFNLIPVPPLDGSSVVERLLPRKWWGPYLAIRPYTLIVVFGLVIIGQESGAYNHAFTALYNWWASTTGYFQ